MLTNANKYQQKPTHTYKCLQMRTRVVELSIYLARTVENTLIYLKTWSKKSSHKIAKIGPKVPNVGTYWSFVPKWDRCRALYLYPKRLHTRILKFLQNSQKHLILDPNPRPYTLYSDPWTSRSEHTLNILLTKLGYYGPKLSKNSTNWRFLNISTNFKS